LVGKDTTRGDRRCCEEGVATVKHKRAGFTLTTDTDMEPKAGEDGAL